MDNKKNRSGSKKMQVTVKVDSKNYFCFFRRCFLKTDIKNVKFITKPDIKNMKLIAKQGAKNVKLIAKQGVKNVKL